VRRASHASAVGAIEPSVIESLTVSRKDTLATGSPDSLMDGIGKHGRAAP
jgi:hypothetical protein